MNIKTIYWKVKTTSKRPEGNILWEKAIVEFRANKTVVIRQVDKSNSTTDNNFLLVSDGIFELMPWSFKAETHGYWDEKRYNVLVEGEF